MEALDSATLGSMDDVIDAVWAEVDERVNESIPRWTNTALERVEGELPGVIERAQPALDEAARRAVAAAMQSEALQQEAGFAKQRLVVLAIGTVIASAIASALAVRALR